MNLRIDRERLLATIDAVAAIGRQADGSCARLALTEADCDARDWVVAELKRIGLAVEIDAIGNIFGTRPGASDGPPVMSGSHIDTVATGGRFDGLYGVAAAIEVIRTLNDHDVVTESPLAVAIFTNEEGARFQPDMMGSLVFAGGMPVNDALAAKDTDGVTVGQELARIAYAGSARPSPPKAFVELHIEQGPILDSNGEVLGAVVDLQAIEWVEVTFRGVSNHAGTCPMALRHDAGYGAARLAVDVRELVRRIAGSQVGTVGRIRLEPNLVNVIARQAAVTVDLRNTDDQVLARVIDELTCIAATVAEDEGLSFEIRKLAQSPAVRFDEGIVEAIEKSAAELGYPIRRMTSGAGHDAQMIARICPTAMIFVPSIGGISHNPRENTLPEHLEIGANVLLHTLVRLAGGEGAPAY